MESKYSTCRLCTANSGYMYGLFQKYKGDDEPLYKKIIKSTNLQISVGDGLPSSICHLCFHQFEPCKKLQQKRVHTSNFDAPTTNLLPSDSVVIIVNPNASYHDFNCDSDSNEQQRDVEIPDLNDFPVEEIIIEVDPYDYNTSESEPNDMLENDTLDALPENVHKKRDGPYACNQCDKSYYNIRCLRQHVRTNHTDKNRYKCTKCTKCFGRNAYLKNHMVTHIPKQKHICLICGASLSGKCALKGHMKSHSRKSN